MSFVQSFSSLGYSSIVLVLTYLFIGAALYNGLIMHKRPLWAKLLLSLFLLVGLYASTIFLADQRAKLYEGIRSEGGLKRTFPKN